MNTTATLERPIISPESYLHVWLGHRNLTRKIIEVFPEKDLFTFSVGAMRPFAEICKELIVMPVGGLKQIVTGIVTPYDETSPQIQEKADLLQAWDEANEQISVYFPQITLDKFHETVNLFGAYNFPVIENIQYIVDNEIHHRGQGYVYLRALGIEPPFFWERN